MSSLIDTRERPKWHKRKWRSKWVLKKERRRRLKKRKEMEDSQKRNMQWMRIEKMMKI
jgi:hypothetical protein